MEQKKTIMKLKKWLYILLVILCSIFIVILFVPDRCIKKEYAHRIICQVTLRQLSSVLSLYKDNNQMCPLLDQWCDDLKQSGELVEKCFLCPADKTGPCSYAIN